MRRFSPAIVPMCALGILGLGLACDAPVDPLISPQAEDRAIRDGRDPGLQHVFFLPPIDDQGTIVRTAPFDLTLRPRIEVCELTGLSATPTEDEVEAASCGDLVDWFEMDAAKDGSSFIEVTPEPGGQPVADSMYSVNWKSPSAPDRAYRVSVLLPDLDVMAGGITVEHRQVAYFDAFLYANSSSQLDPTRVVGFTAGRNFPIKLIAEVGASCNGLDCFAYSVDCDGGTFRTDHAGVMLEQDWAAECGTTDEPSGWLLFQERLPDAEPCLPPGQVSGLAFDPCYVWQLVQVGNDGSYALYNENLQIPAIVEFCIEGEALTWEDMIGIYRSSSPYTQVDLVPNVEEAFSISCPYVQPTASGLAGLLSRAQELLWVPGRLLGITPPPLYAGDRGDAGATIRMSYFQWVLWMTPSISSAPTAGVIGSTLPDPLTVQLLTPPHHEGGAAEGVDGQPVTFEVTAGDASLSATYEGSTSQSVEVYTANGGFASVYITLGSAPGSVTITVTGPGIDPLSYTLEAVDLTVTFLEPLDTGDFPGSPDELFEPTVLICPFDGSCASPEATFTGEDVKMVEKDGRKFYQTDWKPRDSGTGPGTYEARVVVDGVTVGTSIPIEVTSSGKDERVGGVYYNRVNSTLPLKFTVTRMIP